jgi:hypothetical protein
VSGTSEEIGASRPFKFVFHYALEGGLCYSTPPEDRLDKAGAEALRAKLMPNIIAGRRAISLEIVEVLS